LKNHGIVEEKKRETPEMHSMPVKVDHEAVRSLSITIKSCFERSEEIKITCRMNTAQMHGKSAKEQQEKFSKYVCSREAD
jgi:hypothetical protein